MTDRPNKHKNALEYIPTSEDKRLEIATHNLREAEKTIAKLETRLKEVTEKAYGRLAIENVIYYDSVEGKNKKLVVKDAVFIENKGIRILVELPEIMQKKV